MPQSPSRKSIGSKRNPETQKAVRAACKAVLSERGLSGFSVEAVAKRARAGKPTIYKWWGGRAGLLLDLYRENEPDRLFPNTGSLREDIAGFLLNLMDHWQSGAGDVFRAVIAEAQQDKDALAALDRFLTDRSEVIGAMVEKAVKRGEASTAADPLLVAELLSGLALQRLLSGREMSVKDAGVITDHVLDGVLI